METNRTKIYKFVYTNIFYILKKRAKKLFLDAVFETTINGQFEVESGSELEIK